MPSKGRNPSERRRKRKNPLIAAGVTQVDYKDVALLKTFVSERGKIRSRRVTGLTPEQQRGRQGGQERPRDGAPAVPGRPLTTEGNPACPHDAR